MQKKRLLIEELPQEIAEKADALSGLWQQREELRQQVAEIDSKMAGLKDSLGVWLDNNGADSVDTPTVRLAYVKPREGWKINRERLQSLFPEAFERTAEKTYIDGQIRFVVSKEQEGGAQ